MTSLLITPNLDEASVTTVGAAKATRDLLVAEAALVKTVTDRLDYDAALPVLKSLKEYVDAIEVERVRAKAKPLEIGKQIDAIAKDLVDKAKAEKDRISKLLGSWEVEERRKADEARRQAEAETARIAHEAQKQATAARMAAPTAEAADRASDAVIERAQSKIVEIKQTAINAVVPKTAGTSVRTTVQFEVTDMKALYTAHPEMVTLEPNGTVIRAVCRANPNLQVPGLRHWSEAKLS